MGNLVQDGSNSDNSNRSSDLTNQNNYQNRINHISPRLVSRYPNSNHSQRNSHTTPKNRQERNSFSNIKCDQQQTPKSSFHSPMGQNTSKCFDISSSSADFPQLLRSPLLNKSENVNDLNNSWHNLSDNLKLQVSDSFVTTPTRKLNHSLHFDTPLRISTPKSENNKKRVNKHDPNSNNVSARRIKPNKVPKVDTVSNVGNGFTSSAKSIGTLHIPSVPNVAFIKDSISGQNGVFTKDDKYTELKSSKSTLPTPDISNISLVQDFVSNENDLFTTKNRKCMQKLENVQTPKNLKDKINYPLTPAKIAHEFSLKAVKEKKKLDIFSKLYGNLINQALVPNILVELFFLFQLLSSSEDSGKSLVNESEVIPLVTLDDCLYFASVTLSYIFPIIQHLNVATLNLLSENTTLQIVSPNLVKRISELHLIDQDLPEERKDTSMTNVSFQSDTDSKKCFPNDLSFSAFSKQRNHFYEIIRNWQSGMKENPHFNFSQHLVLQVKKLLGLSNDPTNYLHLVRLWVSQMLSTCLESFDSGTDDSPKSVLTEVAGVTPEKIRKLEAKLMSGPSTEIGPCPTPKFPANQEMFKCFILAADNQTFNELLISELTYRIQQEIKDIFPDDDHDEINDGKYII